MHTHFAQQRNLFGCGCGAAEMTRTSPEVWKRLPIQPNKDLGFAYPLAPHRQLLCVQNLFLWQRTRARQATTATSAELNLSAAKLIAATWNKMPQQQQQRAAELFLVYEFSISISIVKIYEQNAIVKISVSVLILIPTYILYLLYAQSVCIYSSSSHAVE